ncbi:MAG TPA: YicC family protein [Firmicutes bacterium]|nr:YicC family protein [Bacillota bacterium]
MLFSMTGYGEATIRRATFSVRAEIRSYNHRGFDWSARLPAVLAPLEDRLREVVRQFVRRGRVEISLTLEEFGGRERKLYIDWPLVEALLRVVRELPGKALPVPGNDWVWSWILGFPGVVNLGADELVPELAQAAEEATGKAAEALHSRRRQEGGHLEEEVRLHLQRLRKLHQALADREPELTKAYRERLEKRWEELRPQAVTPEFLSAAARELVMLGERLDIREEIVRLGVHLAAMEEALNLEEPVGRRLDFLAQEVNRELSTVASKAQDSEVALLVVEAKATLEKIREQVANVE